LTKNARNDIRSDQPEEKTALLGWTDRLRFEGGCAGMRALGGAAPWFARLEQARPLYTVGGRGMLH